jgi:type VI secretion system secreted protein Hcp
MASDIFLKVDGIAGESNDSKHKDEIDVSSFSWGLSNTSSHSAGAGGGSGKVQFNDFHFSTNTSKASPLLMKACATGEHIKDATITVRKAGGTQLEFMKVKFSDVLISSYNNAGGGDTPQDQVSLNFAKIEFSFTSQNADGKPGDTVRAGWDLRANRAV